MHFVAERAVKVAKFQMSKNKKLPVSSMVQNKIDPSSTSIQIKSNLDNCFEKNCSNEDQIFFFF